MKSTLSTVLESLLADLGSDASRRGYRSDWAQFTAWLKREKLTPLKVSPKDVKRYVLHLADRGMAQRTRGRALSVIREVYRALVAEELLPYNPAREVKNTKRGKVAKKVTWLEEEPLGRFLAFGVSAAVSGRVPGIGAAWRAHRDVCDTCGSGEGPYCKAGGMLVLALGTPSWTDRRDRMCIQLLAGTGRRRSEVARMRFEDFDEDGVTGVVKGGAEKTAPVPDWLRREIAEWAVFITRDQGPVLPRGPDDPSPITGDMVYLIVKRVAKAVGIDPKKIAPHGIRRSLATHADRRGIPLQDIQQTLGHVSRQTTETYLKGSRKVEVAPGEWMGEMVRPKEKM